VFDFPNRSEDVETALVSRPRVIATASAARISNNFFLIQATPITGCIGKGYRILVSIEITILTDEVPSPECINRRLE
jgi:hypothetical protein